MGDSPVLPGVWKRRAGGHVVRTRVVNQATGEQVEILRVLAREPSARRALAWLTAEKERLRSGQSDALLTPLALPVHGGVYFLLSMAPTAVARLKIGWAKSNIRTRIRDLTCAHPWSLHLLATIRGASVADEAALHARFAGLRAKDAAGSEWFEFRGELAALVKQIRMGMQQS